MNAPARTDAPLTLTEQEADIYCRVTHWVDVLHEALYGRAEPSDIEQAISEGDALLAVLDQIAEDRQGEAA